ncbi:MAG: TldD/PmbA family protein [Pseudomonadota bacterium]
MPQDIDVDLAQLTDLIGQAKRAGADAADAIMVDSSSLSAILRMGETERVERSESADLGLRVFVGNRSAIVSSADRKKPALEAMVERAVAMARQVPEDPYSGLADAGDVVTEIPAIDLADSKEPSAETLIERARTAEQAALAVQGVTNSEAADASWGQTRVWLAASNGFTGHYVRTGSSTVASVVAGEGTSMETDYDFSSAVFAEDLEDADEIGKRAGAKAVSRLNARKVETARVPVVFDPRVANSLLRHLAGAISGPAIARGTSFLKDRMDEQIFADGISVIDDPHRPRGLRSKPFDAEGLANSRRAFIENGRLTSWVMDLASSRQLGLRSTGNASRGTSGPPGPSVTNFYLEPGNSDPKDLIGAIGNGFYVTQMMGQGINMVTGDYSRGASGFWIEKGEIAYPVNEVTVAGNLADMFERLTPANDLSFHYGVDAPTVRVDGMTVAGK